MELLGKGRAGKEAAFRHLYARFQHTIVQNICKKGGSKDEGKELFQNTMVVFYECYIAGKFTAETQLEPYLWGIARNLWKKKRRNDFRAPILSECYEIPTFGSEQALESLEAAERYRADVLKLFSLVLGKESQRILKLAYFDSYCNEVIADRVGKQKDSIKTLKSRALGKLRAYLATNPASQRILYAPFAT